LIIIKYDCTLYIILFDNFDTITVYFDEEDLDIMEACDSRGGVWSVELKAMWVSVMRKCLCKQKHRLPDTSEVQHALMQIDATSGGGVQKASGVAKSGVVSSCSFCFDEAAVEDGLSCSPCQLATTAHFICNSCFSREVSTQCAPDNRGMFPSQECEIVCRACVSTNGMLRIPFSRRALYLSCDEQAVSSQATEARVLLEQETRFAQRLEESLRQQQQLSQRTAEENEAQRHFQHLAENLFTIKCPNPACRTALFMDQEFDSCFALKCDQCGHQCCGWCMAD